MRRPWRMGLVIVLTIGLDMLFPHQEHVVFWWHRLPGFAALYGLLGCLALVSSAQWLGKIWLARDVDEAHEEESCQ